MSIRHGFVAIALAALVAGTTNAQPLASRIWFGPEMPLPVGAASPYMGSIDYRELFTKPDAWATAARSARVFVLHATWIEKVATPEQLRQAVATLERLHLTLALDLNPLRRTPECGTTEGFAARDPLIPARLVKAAGGTVGYIRLNEPWAWAHEYSVPNACRWPNAKVADQVAAFVRDARALFPDVTIVDVEPLWKSMQPDEILSWLDDYRAETGEYLPAFHLDLDFARLDWATAALRLETGARARHIAFGLQYFGDRADASDAAWLDRTAKRIVAYESVQGGRPDDVVFQSWHDHPNWLLPETAPASFTGLVLHYASFVARGRSPVELLGENRLPESKAGYEISGIVPPGVDTAVIGVRVNGECGGCRGPASLALTAVDYRQEGDRRNRVPNADFASGTAGWTLAGPGIALDGGRTAARESWPDRGPAHELSIRAAPADVIRVNSPRFAVEPGTRYVVRIDAAVAPESTGSGNFTIIFLGGPESLRRTVLF
jgi:hypothetical protein